MVVRSRRTGARSMARGIFATLWIVLAGCSGLYLFMLVTDPAALGGQSMQFSAIAGGAPIPAGDGPLTAADKAKLKDSLQAMSRQMAAIDARLEAAEDYVAPVAALPEPVAPPAAEPAPDPEPVEEEVTVNDTDVETEVVEAAPEPAPEPEAPPPVVTVAPPAPAPVAAAPKPPVTVDAPVVADPPAVAAAPMEPEPEPASSDSSDTAADPAPAEDVEIAAFDPVTLPPAANDGSTRYGIEIGTVAQRDQLRPLWREFLTNHAALVAGLQPRRVLAPDKKWRLIAGPFTNAEDAEGACSLFKKADRPCAATVYAGDAL